MSREAKHIKNIALSGLNLDTFIYFIGFYPMCINTIPLRLELISPERTAYTKDGSIPSPKTIG